VSSTQYIARVSTQSFKPFRPAVFEFDFDVPVLDCFRDRLGFGFGCQQVFVGALVPNPDLAGAIFTFGNLSAELCVPDRMIFYMHRETLSRKYRVPVALELPSS
jgi:hypothetical protein